MEVIKPCPYCGRKPEWRIINGWEDPTQYTLLRCPEPTCPAHCRLAAGISSSISIKRWNRIKEEILAEDAWRESQRSRSERYGYDTDTCLANVAECGGL